MPKIEEFYSTLNEGHISEKDYNHAKEVWNAFRIKNMGEYHDLYLQSDVLLLTDVFENFRNTCMQYYGLDPCHYFTIPGLSWDAMLKMTKVKLELMTNVNMYQFIEKGMRGGVSYIANRYGKANNKYMEGYDEKEPSKYIMYLDANNLYGWAMSQYLPYGSFKWLSDEELNKIDLGKHKEDSREGLVLEVDLEYPNDLHELHNDYPLAPEKVKVFKDMLSEYCNKISEKYKIPFDMVNKLIPTLNNKKEYVVHYRNLQLYMDLGLKVTKVHRALKFKQSPWLKQYIDFNTNKRKEAKTSFKKDFFKLMNNSIFGKTMENLRKRIDIRLVTNVDQFIKLTSKPTFVSSKIFNKNLVAVHKIKETLKLNRPAYVGMSILDLSKTLMYDFHYNYIKKEYGSIAKLLFTDTDSLTYEIETEDVYKDLRKSKEFFDNSDYPKGSPYEFQENKKVIGKFKDEAFGKIISEFVGLRSKMYSYIMEDGKKKKNLRKRIDIRLVTNVDQFIKLTSKPTFVSSKIFNKNLVAVHKIKETLKLNRPAYVGMSILDLSKTLMYDFHYNYIKKEYGSIAKLLFTDTDSLTYEIETEDVYKDLRKSKEFFDNSDYPKGSPYEFQENKKVIGKFKDEAFGKIISEFVGLRSKMYSYIMEDGKGGMTTKGIKKNVIKKNIMHEDYKNTLLNEEQMRHKMRTIRSVKHKLQSFEINKISLSCLMTSAISMIMEHAVMPMDTTK